MIRFLICILALGLVSSVSTIGQGAEWTIPIAGNAFRLERGGEGGGFQRDGSIRVSKPSVHLNYETPKDVSLQYAYSEITVPVGMDIEGSYFMANGFVEGYFGFQVNGPQERRVLFSVWSPYKTDNPKDIPEEQRIAKLASGPGVRVGEFGNEGSGGQSFLVYPWKAGVTYRFLTEVKPDPTSKEHTHYTAWFGDKSQDEWRLIASFRRPKTSTYLKGFHSFLENFNPQFGHL